MRSLIHAARRPRAARVDDDVAPDRADVFARQAAAGVAVVHQPVVAADVTHQHHHMARARGHHARRRRGAREFSDPVDGEIELGANLTEHIERGLAAAEPARTAGGPAADNARIAVGIDDPLRCGLYPIGAAALVAHDHALAGARTMMLAMLRIGGRGNEVSKDRQAENGRVLEQ